MFGWYVVSIIAVLCVSYVGMKLGEHSMDSLEAQLRRDEHDNRMKLRIALNTLDYWFREHVKDYTRFGPPSHDGLKRWQEFCADAIEADHRRGETKSRDYIANTKHGTIGIRLITETPSGRLVSEQCEHAISDEMYYCLDRLRRIYAEADVAPDPAPIVKEETKGAAQ
jgi:hypothetical protein